MFASGPILASVFAFGPSDASGNEPPPLSIERLNM